MKSITLILPGNMQVTIIESPMLAKPWPDEDGQTKYRQLFIPEKNEVYVHNIYVYLIGLFGITDGTRASCSVAKHYLNQLIDKL